MADSITSDYQRPFMDLGNVPALHLRGLPLPHDAATYCWKTCWECFRYDTTNLRVWGKNAISGNLRLWALH